MTNALRIDKRDNVVVAVEEIKANETVTFDNLEGEIITITCLDNIPIFHKIATDRISKGDYIIKYGEHIGIAATDIEIGNHVHLQNVEDNRENLKDKE